MSESIYHLCTREAWSAAQDKGIYTPPSLAEQGFIHCSRRSQISRVAESFFAGIPDLVLIQIDPGAVKYDVRWEPGTDWPDQLFPHIYGPLNLDAVIIVIEFPPNSVEEKGEHEHD